MASSVKNAKFFRQKSAGKCEPAVLGENLLNMISGINYFADLRMTFRQNCFLQDWFRNKFGVGLD
jgi:hypothetical protein